MVNHLKPDRVVRVTTLYCRVSRFWWKFLRNVFFQVRLTQLLKRSSTISIFLKSDKFSLRNDLFSPANQAAIKFIFSRTHNFLIDDHFDLIVKPIKRSWLELSETLPFFAKRSEKRCFLLIATFAKIDFCPNSEFSLMKLKFSFQLRNIRYLEAQLCYWIRK